MPDTENPEIPDETGDEDEQDTASEVDLDLDELDPVLREALAEPQTVRIGGKVISIPHMSAWPHMANRYMALGAFDAWAESALSERDAKIFKDANLKNYQIEKITALTTAAAGTTAGKARPSSKQRGNTRRR